MATDIAASPEAALDVPADVSDAPQAATELSGHSRPEANDRGSDHLNDADRVALLRSMMMMRGLESRALSLYKQGKVPGSFYDGYGQEAVSAGAAFAMAAEDRLCILHRDLAAHLIRGADPARILAQYMGRAAGYTRGRDGNVHFGDAEHGCLGMVSMLPDMMVVATGMAMAFKLRGERRAALTFCGDGASSRGDFHEALNWAAVQELGVIFIIENNQYAYSTPTSQQFKVDPVKRAEAYGIPGVTVDGNDVEAMFAVVLDARQRAAAGGGPTLIEAQTMRMHGHAAHDDMRYVPEDVVAHWKARDPIALESARVTAAGIDIAALEARVQEEIDAATQTALASPMPDPATAADGVFAESEPVPLGDGLAPWSGWSHA